MVSVQRPQTCDVEVCFTPEAARMATETVWHHTQTSTHHKDGSVTLKFKVDGLEEIPLGFVMDWSNQSCSTHSTS